MIFILIRLPAPLNHDALVLYSSTADDDLMAWNNTLTLCVHECMCVCMFVLVKHILSIVSVLCNSGRVAKEVMEQSAKIKREPPEIHR